MPPQEKLIYGWRFGHPMYWIEDQPNSYAWFYEDDGTPAPAYGHCRECPLCKKLPLSNDHDPCISDLPGEHVSACCGHGVYPPYMQDANGKTLRGDRALKHFRKFGKGPPRAP
jgi:hypothetical protein